MREKIMRGFENSEFESRVKKARLLMDKNHIDLLFVTSPHNFRYFSGLDSYFWESPTRPWFLIIPNNKQPIAVIPSIGRSALEKTWLKNRFPSIYQYCIEDEKMMRDKRPKRSDRFF